MLTNKCTFLGTVFEMSSLSMTQSGKKVCKFTVSVKVGKAQDGKGIYEYIPCRAYEGRAEILDKYFQKGKAISVETHCHRYKADNGTTYTEFIVDDLAFVPNDYVEQTAPQQPTQPQRPQMSQYAQQTFDSVSPDDLPF